MSVPPAGSVRPNTVHFSWILIACAIFTGGRGLSDLRRSGKLFIFRLTPRLLRRCLRGGNRSCKISSSTASCQARLFRGGNGRRLGEFAPDHSHCMHKGEPVGVDIGLEGCLMHQAAGFKVRQHETVELLADEVRGLAAQDDFGAAQMGFYFVESRFDFLALVIERRQFLGRRLLVIQDGSD